VCNGGEALFRAVKPVRAVERTLDILDLLLRRDTPASLAEVVHGTALPKSTAYRLLLTLESRDYLQRTAEDRWELSDRLPRPTLASHPSESAIRTAALPVMEGLRDTCGETVGLHLLVKDERLCIAATEGTRTLRTSGRVGSRAPLYSGASARAIMAHLPEDRRLQIVRRTGLAPLTLNTITDPVVLEAELARIRSTGYAVSHGEWDEGITSVAAPLFGPGESVVASINVSGPTFRFQEGKIALLAGALRAAARAISRRLGASGEPDAEAP
jgi:DNA-binding IclR family transcriptional regulator